MADRNNLQVVQDWLAGRGWQSKAGKKWLTPGGPLDHTVEVWTTKDIAFNLIDDMTSDPVVTAVVSTPYGLLKFMAEPEVRRSILVLHGTHVQDARPNAVGAGNLMVLAQALMERMGFDGLVIEGAVRTTGANPGRRPRPFRFTRNVRPAPNAGPGT